MLHTWTAPEDFSAETIATEFDRATIAWHTPAESSEDHPALRLHRANFTLWHLDIVLGGTIIRHEGQEIVISDVKLHPMLAR